MRFECDSCHAKYRISDEKVAGRLVRFPCRRCEHKILIDGRRDDVTVPAGPAYGYHEPTRKSPPSPFLREVETSRQRRPPSAMRRRPSSIPPRRPTSVSRRASAPVKSAGPHPGLSPPLPARSSAAVGVVPNAKLTKIEWHVSVNDVPIGPISLEEMGHKVDAGAVSEYSLVWREGLDDWRPLATVPELMSLLYERRSSGPPTRSSFSSMPPFVEEQTAIKHTPEPPSAPPVPPRPPVHAIGVDRSAVLPSPDVSVDFLPLSEALQSDRVSAPFDEAVEPAQPAAPFIPEPEVPMTPSAPVFSGLPQSVDKPLSVPTVPPQPVQGRERRSLPWVGALLLGVAVFSAVVAALAFHRYGDVLMERFVGSRTATPLEDRPPELPVESEALDLALGASAPAAPGEEPSAEPAASDTLEAEPADASAASSNEQTQAEASEPEQAEELKPGLAAQPPGPMDAAATIAPAKPQRPTRARRAKARSRSSASTRKAAHDGLSAEEQRLLDDFGASAAVAKIDVENARKSKRNRAPLDSKAVSSTVTSQKPRLQRCYERAIRGQQSPPAVRMNVALNVAPSGRVSSVNVSGNGPGGLAQCMEASIRRWRFPASSEGGPAAFPVVFSAN